MNGNTDNHIMGFFKRVFPSHLANIWPRSMTSLYPTPKADIIHQSTHSPPRNGLPHHPYLCSRHSLHLTQGSLPCWM